MSYAYRLGPASEASLAALVEEEGGPVREAILELPVTHTHPATGISDSSSVGRAVLTAADQAAARAALGVSTGGAPTATTTVAGISELADDTEAAAGTSNTVVMTPARSKLARRQQITARTAAHTAAAADVEKLITMTHGSSAAVTLPSDATDAGVLVGDWIEFLQLGAGQTTFTAGSGATLVVPTGASAACRGLNCRVVAQKIAANTYALGGDLA